MSRMLLVVGLLIVSNCFMTLAMFGRMRDVPRDAALAEVHRAERGE